MNAERKLQRSRTESSFAQRRTLSRRGTASKGSPGDEDGEETGGGLEGAALKAKERMSTFVRKSIYAHSGLRSIAPKAEELVPKVEARVRRTWFTRRDQDGRTVLVQVEEGVDEDEETTNVPSPSGSSIMRRMTTFGGPTGISGALNPRDAALRGKETAVSFGEQTASQRTSQMSVSRLRGLLKRPRRSHDKERVSCVDGESFFLGSTAKAGGARSACSSTATAANDDSREGSFHKMKSRLFTTCNGSNHDGDAASSASFSSKHHHLHLHLPAWVTKQTRRSSTGGEEEHDPFKQVLHSSVYIHPDSRFMRVWDSLTLFLCSAYFTMLVPLRIAFPALWPTPTLIALDIAATALLLADCMLRFYVAFESSQFDADEVKSGSALYSSTNQDAHLVVDRDKIVRRHLRFHFWVGLIGGLPFDLIALLATTGSVWPIDGGGGGGASLSEEEIAGLTSLPAQILVQPSSAALCGLTRLAVIAHLASFFDSRESYYSVSASVADRVVKNMLTGCVGAHYIACGFIFVAMQAEVAGKASHLSTPGQLAFYEAVGSVGPEAMYARAIYW
jgi:hypothetical protein